MKTLITGSSGHLGEALVRTLREMGRDIISADIKPATTTTHVGDLSNRTFVKSILCDVESIFHCATLHKPHIETHTRQQFIDSNITATLNLLEEAIIHKVNRFIFTSTTSVFGYAMQPKQDQPAVWVTEKLVPVPKNIYGITKITAENLCEQISKDHQLPCIILRTSRFFPEEDDSKVTREKFANDNAKLNELLNRRADIEDIVSAHLCAEKAASKIHFDRFIISATTPFSQSDLQCIRTDLPTCLKKYIDTADVYARNNWSLPDTLDRVYVNDHARNKLGWKPLHNFKTVLERVDKGGTVTSALAKIIGAKGYHDKIFKDGPYPVREPDAGK